MTAISEHKTSKDKDTLGNPSNRIGLFGGTFDPIHFGHIACAKEIKTLFSLSEVKFIPNALPPHKAEPESTSKVRFHLTSLAIDGIEGFTIDSREILREGYSFTIDTLKSIHQENPESALFFIMGKDAFKTINQWKDWQHLLDYCHLVVVNRGDIEIENNEEILGWFNSNKCQDLNKLKKSKQGHIYIHEMPSIDISSTEIRDKIMAKENVDNLLPQVVSEYITKNKLYIN